MSDTVYSNIWSRKCPSGSSQSFHGRKSSNSCGSTGSDLSTDLLANGHTSETGESYRTPLPDPKTLASQPFAQFGARHTGVEPAIQIEIENPCSKIQPDSAAGKI